MADAERLNRPRLRTPAAMWLPVAALAVAAAVLLAEVAQEPQAAQAQAGGTARAGNLLVVAGQVTSDTYGVYLVDTERQTMAIYQWLPTPRKLRLIAARYYAYDLQLQDFNNEEKSTPSEIRKMVEAQNRAGSDTRPAN